MGVLEGVLGNEQPFDHVVIGGGTAGNRIAYRLAEAGFTVAIIERGLSYELGKPVVGAAPVGDIIGVGSNPLNSILSVDSGCRTTPQPGAAGREVHYAQGKILGRSSALKFMIHHRPNRGVLDLWAEMVGDDSYTWADQPKNGKHTADLPTSNPNWLTHEADMEVAIAVYRRLREIFDTDPIKSIRADPSSATGEYWPGADIETDEEILANIHASVMDVMHALCTNRVGRADEETAVVDNRFRVIGVSGLRVVDASVLPLLTPSHPQALIYALAEKLADDIIKVSL